MQGYVRVYRNLRKGAAPIYSIQHYNTAKRGWRVVERRSRVLLTDVYFVVQKAGRQRVIREQQKNVHAFAMGRLCDERGAFGIDADTKKRPARATHLQPVSLGIIPHGQHHPSGGIGGTSSSAQ